MRTITLHAKFLAAICLALIVTLSVRAQEGTPLKMSYQAVVRDGTNKLLENKVIGMQISILQGSATGSPVYSETHQPTTNVNGLVSVVIGEGRSTNGAIALIDWSKGPFFVETEIDPAGGSNYSITSTTQLLSVPFALYAEKAGNGFDGQYESLQGKPDFAYVATTGNYEDLDNKPEFSPVATTGSYNDLADAPVLADVATTGSYDDLDGKPQFANVAITGSYNDLTDRPVILPIAISGKYSDLSGTPELSAVATSGKYEDLTGKPTKVSSLENDAQYLVSETQELRLDGTSLSITNGKDELVNTITLPSASTGGVTDYEQLTNKPEGNKDGDLLYWNNADKKWNVLGIGLEGQILSVSGGKLTWTEPTLLTNTEMYAEGELFYQDGKPEGIIIETNKMSRTGLLLSLNEYSAAWSTTTEFAGANDSQDGSNNMSVIASISSWENNYPAFRAVRQEGENWYIPSVEELKLIQQNATQLNSALTEAGGTALASDFYWASTERDTKYAYGLTFNDVSITDPDTPILAGEQYMIVDTVTSSTGLDSLVFVSWEIPAGIRIEGQKDTELKIRAVRKLSWTELNSKPLPENSYQVGDIYLASDKATPLGIVYQVSGNGSHGKVLSISESESALSWSDAATWCNQLGGAWVIPTSREWKDIASIKTMLNTVLVEKGYKALQTASYWSSTEDEGEPENAMAAKLTTTESGGAYIDGFEEESTPKTSTLQVRAILEF